MSRQAVATNILALSYLFPNRAQPTYGVFVLNRLRAIEAFCKVKVVAPVQWYPFMRLLRRGLWNGAIPVREEIAELDVHHPRFAVIPRFMKWLDPITYYFSVRAVVERLIRDESFEFDLIDVHWTYPDIVAAHLLAARYGKKLVVTVRGHEALYREERSLRRWLVAHYLRKADRVVTLSAELREKVVALGVNPANVRVVLNGVDRARFRPLDPHECRLALGLPTDKKIVISVGRLAEGKGHQDLIRALPRLTERNVELFIIGGVNPEDNFEHELRRLIRELGLGNVHLVDKVAHEALPSWYAAADVFCLATRREGCPNVVLEALACGTPAVVTNVGAASELIKSGQNGYLVESVEELASSLDSALAHEWERHAVAASMEGWGWTSCAEQLQLMFDSLLSAP